MNTEQIFLSFIEGLSKMDFSFIITLIKYLFVAFWLIVVGWVWVDAGERSTHKFAQVGSAILVAVFNVIGLIIYLLIRPKQTIQELYWADLERRYLKYETSELGDCPNCRFSLQPGFNSCPKCGYSIKKQCANCQVWVDKSYKYCPFCTTPFESVQVNRTVVVEETPVAMQEEVNKSKEEAINVVENNQTKYVDRHGIVSKVRMDFANFVKKIGDNVLKMNKEKQVKVANAKVENSVKRDRKDKKKKDKKKKNRK